jgi:hypothetical protein
MKIKDYFSAEELAIFEGLSDREKLSLAVSIIKERDSKAQFTTKDVVEFLGRDPNRPNGVFSMVNAIYDEDSAFPKEMIVSSKGKQTYNKDKVAALKARLISQLPTNSVEEFESTEHP